MGAALEGYASVSSVAAGDVVDFHVRADATHSHFTMEIVRRGVNDEPVLRIEADAFTPGAQDDATLATRGCDWPPSASARTQIPAQWRSGYYVAKLKALDESASIPFFVRSATPGATSRTLLKMSDTTAQAYTAWGGRSLYSSPHAPDISFDRPYDDMDLFERYQLPFIRWAEASGIVLDYCSSLDLHRDPRLLEPYRLLISLGHDEYWSLEMRDQVEAFLSSGGNVAFLSANTCYWQIRLDLSEGRRVMTCYKETEGNPPDPQRDDPRRVTVRWYEPPLLRPESRMTGVSYHRGAGWWIDPTVPQARFRGYTVTAATHWAYAGTGLSNGDVFGNGTSVDDSILGYETDAIDPDGTPGNFIALATADLSDWKAHGQGGNATMGLYRRGGVAFTAGTVNWAGGLGGANSRVVEQITRNVLRELARDPEPQLAVANAGFEDWASGVPVGWALDGAGSVSRESTDADALANQMRFDAPGSSMMRLDARAGETWITCSDLALDGAKTYGAGAWIKSSTAGATIRLQTTDTWTDFATASHSGGGQWEYVFATGSIGRAQGAIPARVKAQVSRGTQAIFDNVRVVEIVDPLP